MLRRLKRVFPLLLIPIGVVVGLLVTVDRPTATVVPAPSANVSTLCAEINTGNYSQTYVEAGVPNTALLLPGETLTFRTDAAEPITVLIGHQRELELSDTQTVSYTVTADRPQGPLIWRSEAFANWTVTCALAPAVERNADLLALTSAAETLDANADTMLDVKFANPTDEALTDVSVQCRVLAGDLVFMDPVETNGAFPNAQTTAVTVQLGIRPELAPGQMLSSAINVQANTEGSVQCLLYSGDTPLASDELTLLVR